MNHDVFNKTISNFLKTQNYILKNSQELQYFIRKFLIFILKNTDIKDYITNLPDELYYFNENNFWFCKDINILGKIITSIHYIFKYGSCDKINENIKEKLQIRLETCENFIIQYIKKYFKVSKIIKTYRIEKSYNGYSLDILKSALQKYIRRGIVDKAIYFAIEISLFLFTDVDRDQKRIVTNFIHRLQIIFLEDVGLGCYDQWENIDKLFDDLEKRDVNTFIFSFIKLVITMTINKHIRICSHYNNLKILMKEENLEKVKKYLKYFPSFIKYQKLIINNKNKNIEQNYINSVKNKEIDAGYWVRQLENDDKLKTDTINKIFIPLKDIRYANISKKWTKELNTVKERFLPYYTTILYNYFNDKIENVCKIENITNFELLQYLSINLEKKIEPDDYVIDMHTKLGKQKKKGVEDFVYHGTKVDNELYINDESLEWKDFYDFTKLINQVDKLDERFLKNHRLKKET